MQDSIEVRSTPKVDSGIAYISKMLFIILVLCSFSFTAAYMVLEATA